MSDAAAETSFLLDTQILIWSAIHLSKLAPHVTELLERADVELFVSSITIAEIEIKTGLGKLELPGTPIELCRELGATEMDLTWNHAALLSELPPIHKDPFDRLLIAQAIAEDITLITSDELILRYPQVKLTRN